MNLVSVLRLLNDSLWGLVIQIVDDDFDSHRNCKDSKFCEGNGALFFRFQTSVVCQCCGISNAANEYV